MVNVKELKKGNYIIHNNEAHIINNVQIESDAKLSLRNIFTRNELDISLNLNEEVEEADVRRRCASIISKLDENKLEIIDAVNFETINADISKELFEQASENDQVTYLKFKNLARVIEIRKQ